MSRQRIVLPNRDKEMAEYSIVGLDIQENTIHMNVNGCKVTLVCRPQPKPEIYEKVKEIRISTIYR